MRKVVQVDKPVPRVVRPSSTKKDNKIEHFPGAMNESRKEGPLDERICPNCQHFYEHGKTEWEDAKECEDCTRRGGIFDNWEQRPVLP
jgi:hypothetical protein